MNLCPRGHDKDATGVTTHNRCRECHRADTRARKARQRTGCTHPGPCDRHKISTGATVCYARLRVQAEAQRKDQPTVEDGWEDEFGPIEPLPEGYVDWVQEARDRASRPPARVQRASRPVSGTYGIVGSSVRGPRSHTSIKGRRTPVYGFIGH